jgi:hypothetical protein
VFAQNRTTNSGEVLMYDELNGTAVAPFVSAYSTQTPATSIKLAKNTCNVVRLRFEVTDAANTVHSFTTADPPNLGAVAPHVWTSSAWSRYFWPAGTPVNPGASGDFAVSVGSVESSAFTGSFSAHSQVNVQNGDRSNYPWTFENLAGLPANACVSMTDPNETSHFFSNKNDPYREPPLCTADSDCSRYTYAFLQCKPYAGGGKACLPGSGDLNSDGRSEVIWHHRSGSGEVGAWFYTNALVPSFKPFNEFASLQNSSPKAKTQTNFNWRQVGVGDFLGDGASDILWHNDATGENAVWNMGASDLNSYWKGDLALPTNADLNWRPEAVGDLDGDRRPDLLWRYPSTGATTVWTFSYNASTGTLSRTIIGGLSVTPSANETFAGIADFNKDGKSDIIVRNTSTNAVSIWLMNGLTRTGVLSLPTLNSASWQVRGAVDLDRDNNPDILLFDTATKTLTYWKCTYANGTVTASSVSYQSVVADNTWLPIAGF